MFASVIEVQRRARDEVGHGSGDKDLPRLGQRLDARGDVDPKPCDVVAPELDLSDVDSRSHLDAQGVSAAADRPGAPNGPGRSVERGQDAIARHLDQPAAVSLDLTLGQGIVPVEHEPPLPVAQLDGAASRVDDVSEQHAGQHPVRLGPRASTGEELLGFIDDPVGVLGPPEVVRAWQLDMRAPSMCAAR